MIPALPFVSIVMPIRNEREHIVACLESVVASDYPADRLELLIIDGMSDDGTRDLIADLAVLHPQICVVENPERVVPHALNRGIDLARGEVIIRMDAHAIYPNDYVRRCVIQLLESKADNVGGVCATVPGAETPMARAIAAALSHPFGVGNAYFRVGAGAPRWVDTVPFGCWKRELLRSLGGFATNLPRNQDDELNARILRRGGRILLDPAIHCSYFARTTLRQVALMLYQYGYYKPVVAKMIGRITTTRQLAPPLLVATICVLGIAGLAWPTIWIFLLLTLAGHLGLGLTVGLVGVRLHGFPAALKLPLVFGVMHGAYGLGYLRGLFDLVARKNAPDPAQLSR